MKKVKLKVSHTILSSLTNDMAALLERVPDKTTSQKIMVALWVECWLCIQEKSVFKFEGERKLSLSVPRALALMEAVATMNPEGELEQTQYLKIIHTIHQQTA